MYKYKDHEFHKIKKEEYKLYGSYVSFLDFIFNKDIIVLNKYESSC
jgi:hypothetical protein